MDLATPLLASLAQPNPRLIPIAVTSIFLSIFGVLAFIEGLGMRLSAFWF